MLNIIYVFIKRGFVTLISYKLQFALTYLKLFLTVTIFYFISKLVGGSVNQYLSEYNGNYAAFIITGVTFHSFISTSMNSFSSAIRLEQKMGTLEFLLMSKTRLPFVLVCSALWNFILVMVHSIVIFLFAIFIYKVNFSANLFPVFLILLFSVFTFSGIGMISAGFIIAFKQGDPVNWIFGAITGILSGVYFPVKVLPDFLNRISDFLPNTYALEGLRGALLNNNPVGDLQTQILVLLGFSLFTIPAGFLAFRWGFNRARKDGSLVEY